MKYIRIRMKFYDFYAFTSWRTIAGWMSHQIEDLFLCYSVNEVSEICSIAGIDELSLNLRSSSWNFLVYFCNDFQKCIVHILLLVLLIWFLHIALFQIDLDVFSFLSFFPIFNVIHSWRTYLCTKSLTRGLQF